MSEAAVEVETPNPNAPKDIAGSGARFEGPTFDLPEAEIPEVFRVFVDIGLGHAERNYEQFKVGAKEMTGALEGIYSAAASSTIEYAVKLIEAVHSNTNAGFDFAFELAAAKSLPDLVEHSTAYARQQFGTSSRQNMELFEVAQRAAIGSLSPITTSFSRTLEIMTSAPDRSHEGHRA